MASNGSHVTLSQHLLSFSFLFFTKLRPYFPNWVCNANVEIVPTFVYFLSGFWFAIELSKTKLHARNHQQWPWTLETMLVMRKNRQTRRCDKGQYTQKHFKRNGPSAMPEGRRARRAASSFFSLDERATGAREWYYCVAVANQRDAGHWAARGTVRSTCRRPSMNEWRPWDGVRAGERAWPTTTPLNTDRRCADRPRGRCRSLRSITGRRASRPPPRPPPPSISRSAGRSLAAMPRVVANQRERFDNDELFRKLSRDMEASAQQHNLDACMQ